MINRQNDLKNLCLASLLTALLMLFSMLCLPIGTGKITLQFLGVLLIGGLLPKSYALLSVCTYLFLGGLGLPVFAGFSGGIGVLLGATGGFLWGFLPAVLLFCRLYRKKRSFLFTALSAAASLALCYLCGCLWYLFYLPQEQALSALALFVLPYLLPDALKILLAALLLPHLTHLLQKNGFTAGAE